MIEMIDRTQRQLEQLIQRKERLYYEYRKACEAIRQLRLRRAPSISRHDGELSARAMNAIICNGLINADNHEAKNLIRRGDIAVIQKTAKVTEQEWRRTPNCGDATIFELKRWLQHHGHMMPSETDHGG